MNNITNRPVFNHKIHLNILKNFLLLTNLLGLSLYVILRFIFHDLPIMWQEDLMMVANIVAWASAIAVSVSFSLFAGHAVIFLIRNRKHFNIGRLRTTTARHKENAALMLDYKPKGN